MNMLSSTTETPQNWGFPGKEHFLLQLLKINLLNLKLIGGSDDETLVHIKDQRLLFVVFDDSWYFPKKRVVAGEV